jgi:hypothetical protein
MYKFYKVFLHDWSNYSWYRKGNRRRHHKRLVMAQKEWKSERHSTRYYDCHQPATWDKSWRKVEWADKSKGGHQWRVWQRR